MFGVGLSDSNIAGQVEALYGIRVFAATRSTITDKLLDEVKAARLSLPNAWQTRPLDRVYPFVWLDAIHYNIRHKGRALSLSEGRYPTEAVYTVLALNLDGKKAVFGLYLSKSEGAHFWLSVLTDLHNWGVSDILIASVDGLTGFPEAISTIYPQTEAPLCIVHQVRDSLRVMAAKNYQAFLANLKRLYRARSPGEAEAALDELASIRGQKYLIVIQPWRNKWDHLSPYFKYPEAIRRIIYTTNSLEAVHRQFRKLTKTRGGFPNDDSLLKLLYKGIQNASKKWTMPIQNWNLTVSQQSIFFKGRLDAALKP